MIAEGVSRRQGGEVREGTAGQQRYGARQVVEAAEAVRRDQALVGEAGGLEGRGEEGRIQRVMGPEAGLRGVRRVEEGRRVRKAQVREEDREGEVLVEVGELGRVCWKGSARVISEERLAGVGFAMWGTGEGMSWKWVTRTAEGSMGVRYKNSAIGGGKQPGAYVQYVYIKGKHTAKRRGRGRQGTGKMELFAKNY